VQFKFTVSKNVYSLFIKQPKSGEHVSDIGASNSAEESHGSLAVRKVRKYDFISDIKFCLSTCTWRRISTVYYCIW
jgi:hypothetical protein